MLLHIICNGETTAVDLVDGRASIGGGQNDHIRFDGLPVKLVALELEGTRLSITATRALRIGAQLFPAHVTRLVLPGERFTLPNDAIVARPDDEASRERRKNKSTDFLARELLRGSNEDIETRAASLTCVAGEDEGHVSPLAFVETSIGRGDECDVRLRDRTVSRQHARLIHRRGGYLVEDRGTTNGLFVNGKPIKGHRSLSNGDVIELGHTMLRFDAGEKAPEECTIIEKVERPNSAFEKQQESAPIRYPTMNATALLVIATLLFLSGLATALLVVRR